MVSQPKPIRIGLHVCGLCGKRRVLYQWPVRMTIGPRAGEWTHPEQGENAFVACRECS